MKAFKPVFFLSLSLCATAALNGCSESHPVYKSEENTPEKVPRVDQVSINETNSETQSTAVGQTQTSTESSGSVVNLNVLSLAGPAAAPLDQPWQGQDTALITMSRSLATGSDVSLTALVEIPVSCSGGGTQTSVTDNVPPPWFSEGDVSKTVYTDCVNGNTLINGEQSFTVDVQTGQPYMQPDWTSKTTIARDLTRTDLTTGNVTVAKGSASEQMVVTGYTAFEQTLSGSDSRNWVNNDVIQQTTQTYNVVYAWDDIARNFSWDFEVSADSSLFGQTSARTLQTLTGTLGLPPSAGQFQTTSTILDVSSISTITALSTGDVRVETDADGDGVVDSTQTMNWNQLMLDSILYQFLQQ